MARLNFELLKAMGCRLQKGKKLFFFRLTTITSIFESGFHSTKRFVPLFSIDFCVRLFDTIGTQG